MAVTPEQWVQFAMQDGSTLFGEDLPLKQMPPGTSLVAIAQSLIDVARFVSPGTFMPLVPPSVARILQEITASPPSDSGQIFQIESSIYRASFFEGLTEAQIEEKIEGERSARAKERFDAIWAIHRHFADT